MTCTFPAVAVTTESSGTSAQPGSSSPGSDAMISASAERRQNSVSPAAVAAITWPSVSRKLNRPVTPAARSAPTGTGQGLARRQPPPQPVRHQRPQQRRVDPRLQPEQRCGGQRPGQPGRGLRVPVDPPVMAEQPAAPRERGGRGGPRGAAQRGVADRGEDRAGPGHPGQVGERLVGPDGPGPPVPGRARGRRPRTSRPRTRPRSRSRAAGSAAPTPAGTARAAVR